MISVTLMCQLPLTDLQISNLGKPAPTVASDSYSWLTGVQPDEVFCYCIVACVPQGLLY